ncbi:MAG: efflux RND transporter periplasmic adaptor subunit, partial [Proteobacteria bacterium]|nr:efflux RND transporter periplasmic adaptor subunit [Pseudomonadota bacterium]
MKKLFGVLALGLGGFVAAAALVPGFWSVMPEGLKNAVPVALHSILNIPKADGDTAARPAGGGRQAGGNRGGGGAGRPTPVAVAAVERKDVPYRVEAIGTVQAIASVTVRSRVDSQIVSVSFQDGATVTEGQVLAKLDSRAIDAQVRQAEATLARNRTMLELARATLSRGEALAVQNFATKQRLDENRFAVMAQESQVRADEAQLELLRTQQSYYTIRAPISGKAGLANIKPGNIARSSDGGIALTTINQMSPIYVSFSLPQRYFDDLRAAIESGTGAVQAQAHGSKRIVDGKLALVENAMDNATGTIGVRAIFANADDTLWPGVIVNLKVTLGEDKNAVVVPREAVQMSQRGNFVFTVVDGAAKMTPVTVARNVDQMTVIAKGLAGGESVIIDGQLLVVDGAKVQPRQAPAKA